MVLLHLAPARQSAHAQDACITVRIHYGASTVFLIYLYAGYATQINGS